MKFVKKLKNQKGQGMMEYMIITAVVGILCLGAMNQFGTSIKKNITEMKAKINNEIKI